MSDERREVAERLREAALHPDVDGDVWVYDAMAALGLEVGEYEGYVTPESVERLADLIDPTCHLDLTDTDTCGNVKLRTYECSRCGRSCEEIYGGYERCPHCGARVVKTGV